ncbi:MAG: Na+/H+ antiporter NhaA [Thermoleophilia bacterium]|nr:Na+/H+ antiporter NhaA [Thermoleophilia bacterium]
MTTTTDAPAGRTAWARNVAVPLRAFLHTETSGGLVLLAAALAALAWVNSPWGSSYEALWSTELVLRLGDWSVGGDLHFWINDGLMAIFFFVVGLEVRREFDMGELRDRRRAAVPLVAAVGGMAVPIAIYLLATGGTGAVGGWGIVMPTDTAFALGVLAVAGRRAPQRLRAFILTVVIADDVGVLLVIAFAYTGDLSLPALAAAAALYASLAACRRLGIGGPPLYTLLAVGVWLATAKSGVHATIAGVVMGLSITARPPEREELEEVTAVTRLLREQPTAKVARAARRRLLGAVSPNERLQYGLHPWSSFVIVPLFALASAGVHLEGELLARAARSPVTLGILLGLVLGKFLGISLATLVAAHPRLFRLPLTVELPPVFGGAAVAGIGFTLSLLIAGLAFDGPTLEEAKVGILGASIGAALLAFAVFRVLARIPESALRRSGLVAAPPLTDLALPVDPARDHVRGGADAPVTLLEYGDYQCSFCGQAEMAIGLLLREHGSEVRYAWRHLPLTDVHPNAQLAAEAAEAASAQGRFWEMHDRLLAHQDALLLPHLRRYAREIGLDEERFWDELRGRAHAPRVAEDVDSADASGVTGTPSFFVNGRRHEGAYDADTLARLVREADAAGRGAAVPR